MSARGIYAAVVTPTNASGEIQFKPYIRHARWLIEQGCHGLGVFGTTSETNCFSVSERTAALEAYIDGGLDPQKMIVGVGCCARADSVAVTKHALSCGVSRVLLMPPFFYKNNSDEGLFRAIAEVIDDAKTDAMELYLYHFPQMSGVPVTKGVIEKLLKSYPDTVKGLKDSSGDWDHTHDLIRSFPGFVVFSGADNHLLDNLQAGGGGTISAAANINCAANRRVFDAFEAGDIASAQKGMPAVASVRQILAAQPLIPAIKSYMAIRWADEPWSCTRPPLTPLATSAASDLRTQLQAAGLS